MMTSRAGLWLVGVALGVQLIACGSSDANGASSGAERFAAAARQPCVDTVLCIIGFHWSPTQCACVPDGSCATDADCRLFADTCTACDCTALSTEDADPSCSGPGVQCVADPCLDKTAVCADGTCQAAPCVDTQLCIRGAHWSPDRCACVADRPHAPHAPRAPHRPHTPHAPRAHA